MKSTDLSNWELVNYAYDVLDDTDELALRNGKNAYSRGSWASSLRFHDGKFFATTFSNGGLTYVFETADIEKGPWKKTSFRPSHHDHSLVFEEDGRVFMTTGTGDIRLVELNPDLSGDKPGGVNQVIIPNASAVAGENVGLKAEGSQVYKVNGKYYIFLITWPRGGMRTELCFRSDKLTGPYEGKVIIQDRGIAQGGIFDTPDGKWYAMMFRDNGAVGRIPWLIPVAWVDGWPVVGDNGKVPDVIENLPAQTSLIGRVVASDEFDRKSGDRPLPLAWQWNHNPDDKGWSLSERPGFLRLKNNRLSQSLLDTPNLLTQRVFGPQCSGSVAVDVNKLQDGDTAGLAAFQRDYGFVGIKSAGGKKYVVMTSSQRNNVVEEASVPLSQATLYLKVDMNFKERADLAYFSYSLDGQEWKRIGKPHKMSYTIPHFMGYRFALFNTAAQITGGVADFDFFHVSETASFDP
jgi:beta-xylosidase